MPFIAVLAVAGAAATTTAAADSEPAITVTVLGEGSTRQVQELSKQDLATALPGSNPLKTLAKLPGVSFQSADAGGAYEWSARFGIRGFNQNQLGFTLDNVPLGDMSYGNSNGLHIGRAIVAENIARVRVAQGAGDVGTASTSNLGGTVQFYSADPQLEAGVHATQTLGSDQFRRTHLRADSGALADGTRAYLSLTGQRADKWKGDGGTRQDSVNSKLSHPLAAGTLSAFVNYSDRSETDYQDMSRERTRRLGWRWDNYQPDWNRAVAAARGVFSGGVNDINDAYFLGRGLRRDTLAGVSLEHALGDGEIEATLYSHRNKGQGQWYTPFTPSSTAVPLSIRTTDYRIDRYGVVGEYRRDIAAHSLRIGLWLERNLHALERNFFFIDGPQNSDHFLRNPDVRAFAQDFTTTTRQFSAQDSISLAGTRLRVDIGAKSPRVVVDSRSLLGTRADGRLTASRALLPQAGVNYRLGGGAELFGSAARNMRAFTPGILSPFSQEQAQFDASAGSLRPETSSSVDLGYRYHDAALAFSAALYHTDFHDRLLAIQNCAGIVGCPATFRNVGKVVSDGIEATLAWRFAPSWSWFNSLTLNESRYQSDYLDNGARIPVAGKQVVDAPRLMFASDIGVERGGYYLRLGGKYTGRRYTTPTNDARVPGYALFSLSAGYRVARLAGLREVSWQLTLDNLTDKRYFATVGSNGFINSDPDGTFANLLPGAPRQGFLAVSAQF